MELHQAQPHQNYDLKALETSDQGRARGLLDLLAEANANILKDIEPALRQQYESLQSQIEAQEKRIVQLASDEATRIQIPEARKILESLREEDRRLQDTIREHSPAYAALTFPTSLTVAEMQAQLDSNTLMLYYDLGETQSYLWAVTRNSVTSYVLPHGRKAINQAARNVINMVGSSAMLRQNWLTATNMNGNTILSTTSTLSNLILAPVVDQLDHNRLVIVADGELQYVPFAALNLPGQDEGVYTPLVSNNDIINLPSASTIAILRETVINNHQSAPKTLAVLYDPVFELNDERFGQVSGLDGVTSAPTTSPPDLADQLNEADLERVTRNLDLDNIPRLEHTATEGQAILALVPDSEELSAANFEANFLWLNNPVLAQYRYIHVATHGFFDETNPELSGLVLALFDRAGNPQRGYLRLSDLFNLHFSAEMIVLSACQTGLGENVGGEGIVGVTRGLMYAGSPRIVTSLWSIDDAETPAFMQQLYQRILIDGEAPSAALNAIQRTMWQQGKSPYLWAAFTLQGEWR